MGLNTSVHFSLRYFLLSQDWSGLIRSSAVMNSSTIPIQVGKGMTVEPWRSWHKFAVLPPDGSRDLAASMLVPLWVQCNSIKLGEKSGSVAVLSHVCDHDKTWINSRRFICKTSFPSIRDSHILCTYKFVHLKKIVSNNLSIRKIIFSKVSGVLGYIIIYYNSSWTILKWMNEVDPVGFEKNVILSFFYNILSNIVL